MNITNVLELTKSLTGGSAKFSSRPEVKKARDDFSYLVGGLGAGYGAATNINYMTLSKSSVKLADFLVAPLDVAKKVTRIPAEELEQQSAKLFIALIVYRDGKAVDALLLPSSILPSQKGRSCFAKCFGFLKPSPFRFDKNTKEYVLKIKNHKSPLMQKHAFGVVVSKL